MTKSKNLGSMRSALRDNHPKALPLEIRMRLKDLTRGLQLNDVGSIPWSEVWDEVAATRWLGLKGFRVRGVEGPELHFFRVEPSLDIQSEIAKKLNRASSQGLQSVIFDDTLMDPGVSEATQLWLRYRGLHVLVYQEDPEEDSGSFRGGFEVTWGLHPEVRGE